VSDNGYINKFIQYHYNEIYGTELNFNLKQEDTQLVNLIGSSITEDVITSTIMIEDDYKILKNYVILPDVQEPTEYLETRISIKDQSKMNINVLSDPLSGSLSRLIGYPNSVTGTIAYDQTQNEFALLMVNNDQRPIYLKAGSDISIDIDELGNPIGGAGDSENIFLFDYYNTFHKRDQSISERIRSNAEVDFKTFISSLAKQKLIFLNSKKDQLGLSDAFVKDITYDINYWLGYQLLRYTQKHAEYDKA